MVDLQFTLQLLFLRKKPVHRFYQTNFMKEGKVLANRTHAAHDIFFSDEIIFILEDPQKNKMIACIILAKRRVERNHSALDFRSYGLK